MFSMFAVVPLIFVSAFWLGSKETVTYEISKSPVHFFFVKSLPGLVLGSFLSLLIFSFNKWYINKKKVNNFISIKLLALLQIILFYLTVCAVIVLLFFN